MIQRLFAMATLVVLLSGCATLMGYGQNDVSPPGTNFNKQDAMRAYAQWYIEQQQKNSGFQQPHRAVSAKLPARMNEI